MKKLISFVLLSVWISGHACTYAVQTRQVPGTEEQTSVAATAAASKIQVAILLDTSSSMDGLIAQAKTKIWTLVNELAGARKDGKAPNIEIALYEYGNDGIPSKDQFVRKKSGLSTDLDKISEELFKLTTNGGSEYCGYAIRFATEQLEWSSSNSDLKLIFICGNEEFTQGSYSYVTACQNAIKKGIIVNTIHCGDEQTGINGQWKKGAELADGKYMFINQNAVAVAITTPYDTTIQRLNYDLNKTYIAYGVSGNEMKVRQETQDENAKKMSSDIAITRGAAKASAAYTNSSWDLVDATKNNTVQIKELKEEELPAELKGKSDKEKEEYVKKLADERAAIQKNILDLSAKRTKYISDNTKSPKENTLDKAMIDAVKAQAVKKNYSFPPKS